jgi:hypothetical protein
MADQQAHAFRGEFIDLCARVEAWAFMVLASDAAKLKRMPHLFGQKVKAVTDLVTAHPEVFSKPKRVKALFDDFSPYASMRSELAHGLLSCADKNSEAIFAYSNPAAGSLPDTKGRFWLTATEAAETLKNLRVLQKHICDQKLTANPNPSPPQPSQA